MKQLFKIILVLLLCSNSFCAISQSLSFSIITPPCNNDGIVMVLAPSNFVAPITFTYQLTSGLSGFQQIVNSGTSDQLLNYSGAHMFVYASDANNNFASGVISANPFTITVQQTVIGTCPTPGIITATPSLGTAPYSYVWLNGSGSIISTTSTASITIADVYKVLVTDAAGCVVHDDSLNTIYATEQPAFSINVITTNSACNVNNGTASLGNIVGSASLPVIYSWSNSTATSQNITGLAAGTNQQLTLTDNSGCTASASAWVGYNAPVASISSITGSACNASTGAATVAVTGGVAPYTISWNVVPNQTGNTLSNVSAGSYLVTISDNGGCADTMTVNIPSVSTMSVSLNAVPETCTQVDGSISSIVSGGTAPYTYLWSNGATTANISALAQGNYSLFVTDALGCTNSQSISIVQINNLNIVSTTTPASCVFASNGSATVFLTNAVAPITGLWNTGSTASTINNLMPGIYVFTATDALGCSIVDTVVVGYSNATNCYCTIEGYSYIDANANCIKDASETGIPNVQIQLTPFGSTFTDANGYYYFYVPSGNYTLTESNINYYPLQVCQNNGVPVIATASTGCIITNSFGHSVIVAHDLKINNWGNWAVPGLYHQQIITIANQGSVAESAITVSYNHDGLFGTPSFSTVLFTQPNAALYPNWYSNTSALPIIAPFQSTSIVVSQLVPTNLTAGAISCGQDTCAYASPISNWLNDITPVDNIEPFCHTVVSSFDPNYKEVSPKGEGHLGNISIKDSILTYFVHFQNEGTYYAMNVEVLDTLDPNLDWATLKPIYATYPNQITISDNGVLKYKFSNIMLPWKALDDNASQASFAYTIHLKRNITMGTTINNSASIYFDYNPPIRTNKTTNTLKDISNGAPSPAPRNINAINIYPNPANTNINIEYNNGNEAIGAIYIYSLVGKIVHSVNINPSEKNNFYQLNTSELQTGMYLISIKLSNGKVSTSKISIVH
jgi:hypothetical protein